MDNLVKQLIQKYQVQQVLSKIGLGFVIIIIPRPITKLKMQ